MVYDIGDVYPATVTIRDASGNPTEATTIEFSFTLPDGSNVSVTPSGSGGVYSYDFPIAERGLYRFAAVATEPAASYADAFNVVDATWPAFVGLAEVKRHLNIPDTTTTHDEELRGFILSCSEVVESIVGTVARREVTEMYSGLRRVSIPLRRSPVVSVTSVRETGVTLTEGTDYVVSDAGVLSRLSGGTYPRSWRSGIANIEVTYVAGRESVPWSIIDATKELIRINWRPQAGGNYSVFSGGRPDDFGQLNFGGDIRLGFFIPNTVMQRLQPSQVGPYLA